MFDLIFTLFVFGMLLVCERYTNKYATRDQRGAVRAAFARVRNMLRFTAAFQILWGLFVIVGSAYWPEHVSLPDKLSTLLLPGHFAVAILSYLFGIADGVRRSVTVPRSPAGVEATSEDLRHGGTFFWRTVRRVVLASWTIQPDAGWNHLSILERGELGLSSHPNGASIDPTDLTEVSVVENLPLEGGVRYGTRQPTVLKIERANGADLNLMISIGIERAKVDVAGSDLKVDGWGIIVAAGTPGTLVTAASTLPDFEEAWTWALNAAVFGYFAAMATHEDGAA